MNSTFALTIFGSTGDLSINKLFPSLYSLFLEGHISEDFFIVGFSRREYTDQDYRSWLNEYVSFEKIKNHNEEKLSKFLSNIYYQKGDFGEESGYKELIQKLSSFDKKIGACIARIFYLATPPSNYGSILDYLKSTKLSEGCGQGSSKWTKIAIEKPFGKDLETAKSLDLRLADIFEERQIFRVDHYLGKETVQNMIAFRFANGIFDPIWSKDHIDHVQITFAEEEGVKKRGNFFDGVGMLRDVMQNHLMQLVASVVMEQPRSFTKDDLRTERAKAISQIVCIEPDEVSNRVVLGQYEDYLSEAGVDKNSITETFVALKFFVNSKRFENVPFYVRVGKKLEREKMEISIVFKQTCHILFKEYGCPEIGNVLTIRIQPEEGIKMRFIAKKPGNKLGLEAVEMRFNFKDAFGHTGLDAYEKILIDIFSGDQMLFNRSDELEYSWKFISKILQGISKNNLTPIKYKNNSWGPEESDKLLSSDFKKWV